MSKINTREELQQLRAACAAAAQCKNRTALEDAVLLSYHGISQRVCIADQQTASFRVLVLGTSFSIPVLPIRPIRISFGKLTSLFPILWLRAVRTERKRRD